MMARRVGMVLGLVWTLASVSRGAGPLVGEFQADGGLTIRYEYHFDRNSLRASRPADSVLLALTDSGNLLRFDRRTLKPMGERCWAERITRMVYSHQPTS